MSPAEINRQNAQHSTGPRTEAGKAISSQNAVTHGLFTQHDYVPAGQEPEYQSLVNALTVELAAITAAEQILATEIISAAWKLQRCAKAEAALSEQFPDDFLLTENPEALRRQTSIDRARSRAHGIYTRSLAELRRLQTNRLAQSDILPAQPGLADPNRVITVINARRKHLKKVDDQESLELLAMLDHIPGRPPSGAMTSLLKDIA